MHKSCIEIRNCVCLDVSVNVLIVLILSLLALNIRKKIC